MTNIFVYSRGNTILKKSKQKYELRFNFYCLNMVNPLRINDFQGIHVLMFLSVIDKLFSNITVGDIEPHIMEKQNILKFVY